jgi:hypothetical protein
LHVRIINNIVGNYVGKVGSKSYCDGKWHTMTYTYDGSSTAAGVLIYEDGVIDPAPTVESDTLSATIISGSQAPFICSQNGNPDFNCRGPIGYLRLYNVAKSSVFIATNMTPPAVPPCDASALTCFDFQNDTGTTVTDLAATPHNGTLTSAQQWWPQ